MESVAIGLIHASPIVREGVGSLLARRRGVHIIGTFGNAGEALDRLTGMQCVLLYDHLTLWHDGSEALGRFRVQYPQVKILIFGVAGKTEALLECMRAGSEGCLLEDISLDELVAAARSVAAGAILRSPQVVTTLFDSVAHSQPEDDIPPPTPLTPRETQILYLLAEGANNQQIAEQLVLQPQTVKNYVHMVLQKMHLHDRHAVIRSLRSARPWGKKQEVQQAFARGRRSG